MFRSRLAFVLLLAGVAIVWAEEPKKEAPKVDPDLIGEWKVSSGQVAGADLPDFLKTAILTISKTGYVLEVGGMKDIGELTCAGDKSPKEMDIVGKEGPNKGKTIPCIYEIKDGELKVCYSLGDKRPSKMDGSKESKNILIVYKKVDKK